jgi:hypothetical protein
VETSGDSSRMQPLEDGISPHVSRSASSSSLAAISASGAAASAGGFAQQASILACRSPQGLAAGQPGISGSGGSFPRGSSGSSSGSTEADMQKR